MTEVTADINSLIRVSVAFTVDDIATDPTSVFLVVQDPEGTDTQYDYSATVTKDGVGLYHVDVLCAIAGTWYSSFRGTGVCVANVTSDWFIRPAVV